MVLIKRLDKNDEIAGIRQLQEDNLRRNLSDQEAEEQGFVTAEYSLEFLTTMNEIAPSIVAVDDAGRVVGYIIVANKTIREHHELLKEFFDEVDKLHYQEKSLSELNYLISGQLCVAKEYRGVGLAPKMYEFYRNTMRDSFQYCVTDVVDTNIRSIKAHLKVGFVELKTVNYAGENWTVLLWDWTC